MQTRWMGKSEVASDKGQDEDQGGDKSAGYAATVVRTSAGTVAPYGTGPRRRQRVTKGPKGSRLSRVVEGSGSAGRNTGYVRKASADGGRLTWWHG